MLALCLKDVRQSTVSAAHIRVQPRLPQRLAGGDIQSSCGAKISQFGCDLRSVHATAGQTLVVGDLAVQLGRVVEECKRLLKVPVIEELECGRAPIPRDLCREFGGRRRLCRQTPSRGGCLRIVPVLDAAGAFHHQPRQGRDVGCEAQSFGERQRGCVSLCASRFRHCTNRRKLCGRDIDPGRPGAKDTPFGVLQLKCARPDRKCRPLCPHQDEPRLPVMGHWDWRRDGAGNPSKSDTRRRIRYDSNDRHLLGVEDGQESAGCAPEGAKPQECRRRLVHCRHGGADRSGGRLAACEDRHPRQGRGQAEPQWARTHRSKAG